MAVNGVAVSLAVGGGLLAMAGIRNQPLADAVRSVLNQPVSGRTLGPALSATGSGLAPLISSTAAAAVAAAGGAGGGGGALVAAVRSQIGKPYRWSAVGPDAYDCSGLVYWGLRQAGYNPPRFTTATFGGWAKANGWTRYSDVILESQAGDVLVKAGHMAVCSGIGKMIDAPHTGALVREEALWKPYTQWWGWRPAAAADDGRELRRAS